ncbi:hypothetical protein IEO21_08137 [Rhodonia placenta]|uniref:Uncharacterized protein n=1 Tax=Rhodonia placenta TaxID=104341 RepID=A0A8H7NWS0_9APHY|nr:hypothetical protein IEO21_08137 [Postia placenta]
MVQPFPNEIWLDIFKGLLEEGEYDALERCRVVDVSGSEMRRWGGPQRVSITGGNSEDGRRPIPHLATFASRLAGRWPGVGGLWITRAVWRARDLDLDAVLRDLAAFSIIRLNLSDVTLPSILTLGQLASPWSVVRRLYLDNVTFPSVTTFARLLSCVFVKHGFDLRSVPVYPGLPLQLADVDLTYDFRLHSDPCSVNDLVDLFIATGLSENLRRIKACLSPSLRVANEVDVALNRLVKHSGKSLHLSLDSSLSWWLSNGTDGLVHADHSAENTCLEHLDLTVQVTDKNMSHLYAPVVDILSQVTSTHISRIQVYFSPYRQPGAELDVDLGRLMDGLPQLDAVLSGSIFSSLTHVEVDVRTLDRSDVRDEDSAYELRLCLPRLSARGIIGCVTLHLVYPAVMGLHRDKEIVDWARCGVDRVAVQNAVVTDEGTSADGNRLSSNTTTVTVPHDDSDMVSAISQPVWVPPAAYADAQPPFSSRSTDARAPVELTCDDKHVLQKAVASSVTYVDKFAPDDHGTSASKSAREY